MTKMDRRIPRTEKLLQKALIELIRERSFDEITIQDIVDLADVGRTTFYLHYNNKEELFISCHEAIISEFHLGPLFPLSREELLLPEVPPGIVSAYRHLKDARTLLCPIFHGKDNQQIMQRIRSRSAQQIEANLRTAFNGVESNIPIDVLANYLAGAMISMVQWCLEKRHSHTPETLAQSFHHMQRAAIRDAFNL